ncbi:arylsulfatase [Anatilimnocola floriformis]|uniref:arylsulfatase n=1 Tax=Anatilimnocola floriformis TaxID=2948575 RepID=UPI0020C40866|nr:arylsulfatase [Anatilimnocola floriformis]
MFVSRLIFAVFLCALIAPPANSKSPNVVLIITDDQGYGDLGANGNTMIRTPSLDALAKQSTRLTNFHVDPTCAETRSALMTGKYSCSVGVWHTIMGRSILRLDEKIMPQYFAEAGYRCGLFGKWHLGDNYPYRPHERGFHEALFSGGGGVGQTPDHWGNDYFDDTYSRNGVKEKQTGYCTDVWFAAATKFIEQNKDKPFFCYIATNAPHSPYNIEPKYAKTYLDQGVPQPMANFYGMIEKIDENVGGLMKKLDDLQLAENTVVIYMTDNGTAEGVLRPGMGGAKKKAAAEEAKWPGYSAGMRAQKGSQYDGGHRTSCFIRAPFNKSIAANQEVKELTAHFDLLPTLQAMCNLPPAVQKRESEPLDGTSLMPLLTHEQAESWPQRTLVVHSQRMEHPQKLHKCAVMTDQYRLVDGKELYDMTKDPAQQNDIAAANTEVVEKLRGEYDQWWKHVSQKFDLYSDVPLGAKGAPAQELCCHDWHPDDPATPWNQSGQAGVAGNPFVNGWWAVKVDRPGRYRFELRMRPEGVDYKIPAGEARVKIGDQEATAKIAEGADHATIEMDLKPTDHVQLQTWLTTAEGKSRGAYYTMVRRLE